MTKCKSLRKILRQSRLVQLPIRSLILCQKYLQLRSLWLEGWWISLPRKWRSTSSIGFLSFGSHHWLSLVGTSMACWHWSLDCSCLHQEQNKRFSHISIDTKLHPLRPIIHLGLCDLFTRNAKSSSYVLRNTETGLKLPKKKSCNGQRWFSYRGAKMWHDLPAETGIFLIHIQKPYLIVFIFCYNSFIIITPYY